MQHLASALTFFLLSACASEGGDTGQLDSDWTDIASPTNAALNDVVISADEGWAVGDDGTVLRTVDGGLTWTQLDVGTSADLVQIAALSGGTPIRNYVFAAGSDGTIVLSRDGGVSWSVKRTGNELLVAIGAFISDVTDTFAAVGNDGGSVVILTSTDELETWTKTVVRADAKATSAAFSFSEGFVIGERGLLLHSEDKGSSWAPVVTSISNANLYGLDSFSPTIVGDAIAIERKSEGQVTSWQVVGSSALPVMRDLDFDWAIGRSSNGHAAAVDFAAGLDSYVVEDLGITTELRAVSVAYQGVFAVGAGGRILFRAKLPD